MLKIKHKQNKDILMLSNSMAQDLRLSLRAKGLFVYMYSCPDDYEFTVDGLAESCNVCDKTITRTLNELKDLGYVSVTRQGTGEYNYEYLLDDAPQSEDENGDNFSSRRKYDWKECASNADLPQKKGIFFPQVLQECTKTGKNERNEMKERDEKEEKRKQKESNTKKEEINKEEKAERESRAKKEERLTPCPHACVHAYTHTHTCTHAYENIKPDSTPSAVNENCLFSELESSDSSAGNGTNIPPTLEEVRAYLLEKKITSFSAEYFCDYNNHRGWMIGKTKAKNWHCMVSTWVKKKQSSASSSPAVNVNAYPASNNKLKLPKSFLEAWERLGLYAWDEYKDDLAEAVKTLSSWFYECSNDKTFSSKQNGLWDGFCFSTVEFWKSYLDFLWDMLDGANGIPKPGHFRRGSKTHRAWAVNTGLKFREVELA